MKKGFLAQGKKSSLYKAIDRQVALITHFAIIVKISLWFYSGGTIAQPFSKVYSFSGRQI